MTGPEILFNSILKYLDLDPASIKAEAIAMHKQAGEAFAAFKNMERHYLCLPR